MQTHSRAWRFVREHRLASVIIGHVSVLLVVGLFFCGGVLGTQLFGAFAQSPCSGGDATYIVHGGDTLGAIAARYHTSWQKLASYNHIHNANMIYVNQAVCIPGRSQVSSGPMPVRGRGNFFPRGQCTWYAAERYHQLHGIYVPWTTNSDAWLWTTRANQFHWHVSSSPGVGAIIDLQPWVQGAYGLGHVAVVERVLSNGHVIASNMNWGAQPWRVVDVEFAPGPGVTFITF
ncbi:MAG TPA: LysM peptidoglycan-binding domain-containing protein [Ktedonobacteraceae bacterium]|nr:LysM peptidoglycan-binding domain-containing protein [Ktedonobacteraceae bacterium]